MSQETISDIPKFNEFSHLYSETLSTGREEFSPPPFFIRSYAIVYALVKTLLSEIFSQIPEAKKSRHTNTFLTIISFFFYLPFPSFFSWALNNKDYLEALKVKKEGDNEKKMVSTDKNCKPLSDISLHR